jgi:hypothetical protein
LTRRRLAGFDVSTEAGECVEVDPGTTWAALTMNIEIGARLLFDRVMTERRYTDAACTEMTDEQVSTQLGYAEAESDALRIWGIEGEHAEYQEFTVAIDGDVATLTRGACLPLPDCTDSAPTEVIVQRAAP